MMLYFLRQFILLRKQISHIKLLLNAELKVVAMNQKFKYNYLKSIFQQSFFNTDFTAQVILLFYPIKIYRIN